MTSRRDPSPFPDRTPDGTRYDLTLPPGTPDRRRIRREPRLSLFQVARAPRLVCVTWGQAVRLYVANFTTTDRSRVKEVDLTDTRSDGQYVILRTSRNELVRVPTPGTRGAGNWAHEVLKPLDASLFDIGRNPAGTVVSIQPKTL